MKYVNQYFAILCAYEGNSSNFMMAVKLAANCCMLDSFIFRLNIHKMRSCNICVECKNILKRNLKISQAPFNHQ